jgi:hypothetical protein
MAVHVIIFMMACALRSSPSQSLSIEGGNLLPRAMQPPEGVSSRRDGDIIMCFVCAERSSLAVDFSRTISGTSATLAAKTDA